MILYGGGSGVCGGTILIYGGIVVDMKKMWSIYIIDDYDWVVCVDVGILGFYLEFSLNDWGYMLGYFFLFIMCFILGGWLVVCFVG